MTRPVTVRPARLDDLNTIVELRLTLLREYVDHPFYAHLRADAEERAYAIFGAQLASAYEIIFVAERGREIVGLIRCVDMAGSPLLEPERYCYVSSAYVRPAHRHQGVLHALVTAAEAWCAKRGLHEMRLHNSSTSLEAQEAWSSLGFDVVEQVRRRDLSAALV